MRPRTTAGSVDGAFPDQVRIGSIRLGGALRLGSVDALVRSLDELESEVGLPFDGILGAALLREVRYTLDYPEGRLEFPSDPPVRPNGRDVFVATIVGGRPRITALLGDRILYPLVDTGVGDGLVLSIEDAAAVPFEGRRPRLPGTSAAVLSTGAGGEDEGDLAGDESYGVCAVDLRIGDLRVTRPRVRAGRATLIGGGFLSSHRVTFDLGASPRSIAIEEGR